MSAIIGLRQPWQWVQPPDDTALMARLIEARDYAVPARERENLCSAAAARIVALRAENEQLAEALRQMIPETVLEGSREAAATQNAHTLLRKREEGA